MSKSIFGAALGILGTTVWTGLAAGLLISCSGGGDGVGKDVLTDQAQGDTDLVDVPPSEVIEDSSDLRSDLWDVWMPDLWDTFDLVDLTDSSDALDLLDAHDELQDGLDGAELPPLLCVSRTECNDDNECTLDMCDPFTGCYYEFATGSCAEDGSPCTVDMCVQGICQHVPGNQGVACDDGDPCTGYGSCLNGECIPGEILAECLSACGDGVCVGNEDWENCPPDCGYCGDGFCGAHELGLAGGQCPADCLAACGDGVCQGGENAQDCQLDCGGCGDEFCGLNETSVDCPVDCPPTCGNDLCESFETPATCPADCMPPCGNGICEGGENPVNCAVDCAVCGDGICGALEDEEICPADCTAACGNGICQGGESFDSCPLDCGFCGDDICGFGEEWANCPADCFESCGNQVCDADVGETAASCPTDCVADLDGDGIEDEVDLCPLQADPGQEDLDGDGLGDACDMDADGDGEKNPSDCDPLDASRSHLLPELCDDIDHDCDGSPFENADCDDDNPCTQDSCSEQGCEHATLTGSPCSDGNACTSEGTCLDGLCVVTPLACDDNDPCTTDFCNPAVGCLSAPGNEGLACDDGDDCTLETTCSNGVCQAGALAPGCAGCSETGCPEPQDLCSPHWECDLTSELCRILPETAVQCPDSGNPCVVLSCNPENGACEAHVLPNKTSCDDGEPCTFEDRCSSGQCHGKAFTCVDDNPCTQDLCLDGTQECQFVPVVGNACDDGDFCTIDTVCDDEGACVGQPRLCDDGDPCTGDFCDPEWGCRTTPMECPMGFACEGGECVCQPQCQGRQCGEDGCGDFCGFCPAGADCSGDGHCLTFCDQECAGRECGKNSCGVICGTCGTGMYCTDQGSCVETCVPDCTDRECGSDGCGGNCGLCPAAVPYCADGSCNDLCQPDCAGKACGPDGCGGTCGDCTAPDLCTLAGTCGNACSEGSLDESCYDPLASGSGLSGWQVTMAQSLTEFAGVLPPSGGIMLALDSRTRRRGDYPEAILQNRLPSGSYQVLLHWNLLSEEFRDLCGTVPQDSLSVRIYTVDSTLFQRSLRLRDLCAPEDCQGCGNLYQGLELLEADGWTDAWSTGWRTDWFPLNLNPGVNEFFLQLELADVGDGQLHTIALVDRVRFVPCADPCEFLTCGETPCGGDTCGTCDLPGACVAGSCCQGDCEGKDCGNDGCGGSCGQCDGADLCVGNSCVPCQRQCELAECGDDGCGGLCGECQENYECSAGRCLYVPWCGDGQCDPGEDCGSCETDCGACCGNTVCEPDLGEDCDLCPADCGCTCGEQCLLGTCEFMACEGLECGSDGCGGSCGGCSESYLCQDGLCVFNPSCGDGVCSDGEDCSNCPGDCLCGCGHTCNQGTCEYSACAGKLCGTDGCGGSCGTCPEQHVCALGGTCYCVADCVGKICGDDGCGGSCGICDDGDYCTLDTCTPLGQCQFVVKSSDDGNLCTVETCIPESGQILTEPVDCDDGNRCTVDSCNPATGICINTPVNCSDADPCTLDICQLSNGSCTHEAITCDDLDACTTDSCNPADGMCEHAQVSCDDTNPCTTDSCDPAMGCVFAPNTLLCNDGSVCTSGDQCSGGTCQGGTPVQCDDSDVCNGMETCDPVTGCRPGLPAICDDGDACNGMETCDPAVGCLSGIPPTCGDGNPCTDDTCDFATGCINTPNTALCSDDNACTLGDFCSGGSCVPGTTTNCNDGNMCTDDSCVPATGCQNTPNSVACDDGNACTEGDQCAGSACQPGSTKNCDDNNPCTSDSCDPLVGCVNSPVSGSCSDDNVCTEGDHCASGTCVPGSAKDCDDGNLCTTDSCDSVTGCMNTQNSLSCDDGNACTSGDQCSGGTCHGETPVTCDDADACNGLETCDPAVGCVPGMAPECNDGDACNGVETCVPETGCVEGTPPICDDGDACNGVESCLPSTGCTPGIPLDCSDTNVCTDESCDSATGCVTTNNNAACTDDNACTEGDHCSAGSCVPGSAASCDDGEVCTSDGCDPASGCVFNPNTFLCDDGNACTVNDRCSGGSCAPGTPKNCNDSNPCTDDSCNASTGCVNTPNSALCSDGNACTEGDQCGGGSCAPGSPKICADQDACNGVETCDPASGCVPGTPPACDDDDACTQDSCDPVVGCLNLPMTCQTSDECCATQYCLEGTCVNKQANGTVCTDLDACLSGNCWAQGGKFTQGTCCEDACDGICMACDNDGQEGTCTFMPWGTRSMDECASCEYCDGDGACTPVGLGSDPLDDCTATAEETCGTDGFCDGAGACSYWVEVSCAPASCDPGTGTYQYAAHCDGAGSCPEGETVPCSPYNCSESSPPCRTTCLSPGDCVPEAYCNGQGLCLIKLTDGELCGDGTQCQSGFCVDGFCCNVACSGTCQGCAEPGSEGTCTFFGSNLDPEVECGPCWACDGAGTCEPVAAGTDPLDHCPLDPQSSCQNDGSCDGNGSCRFWDATTVCDSPFCEGGLRYPEDLCDGIGNCIDSMPESCDPYACVVDDCLTSCTTDDDCNSDYYCQGTICVPKLADGTPSTEPTHCVSGFVADDVCCATACASTCNTCVMAGYVGTCRMATPDTDPRNECGLCRACGSAGACVPVMYGEDYLNQCEAEPEASCGQDGACDGSGACRLWDWYTVCSQESCLDGIYHYPQYCDGSGICPEGDSTICDPYLCADASTCATSCDFDVECVEGYYCSEASCVPLDGNGSLCSTADHCVSGFCVDGVCCASACDGVCESCALSAYEGECVPEWSGTDPAGDCGLCQMCNGEGTCSEVPAGYDPLDDCVAESTASCGQNGLCDGQGACALWNGQVTCNSGGCLGETFVPASFCDGEGTCPTQVQEDCRPYACAGSGCFTSCSSNTECATGARCNTDAHVCEPSCEGYCGGTNPLGCFCDLECNARGDCCPEVCSFCDLEWCLPSECGPSCVGKECGSDGCGDSCGMCTNGRTCENFTCVPVTEGFVAVANGDFWMGSPAGCPGPTGYTGDCATEPGRQNGETLHYVSLTHPFEMMAHEVTLDDWRGWFRANWNPNVNAACLDCPVESISWYDALAYANLLSERNHLYGCYAMYQVVCDDGTPVGDNWIWCMNAVHGGIKSADVYLGEVSDIYGCNGYRLPTEAEWEFATRAGTLTAYHDGVTSDLGHLNCETPFHLTAYEWTCANAGGETQPVTGLLANPWGLFDMSGNVSEWVWDGSQTYAGGTFNQPLVDPVGSGESKVFRGGAYDGASAVARSARRVGVFPKTRFGNLGFRLVRTIECVPQEEVCGDQIDNDCDGDVDEEGALGCFVYYVDYDYDTFGDESFGGICLCESTAPYDAMNNYDCDDSNNEINPFAFEICDGVDNDCDSVVDEGSLCSDDDPCTNDICNGIYECAHLVMTCEGDGDCCGAQYCTPGGTCAYKLTNGGDCTRGGECESGYCADGYCCNNACDGTCESCGLSAYEGYCLPSWSGTDPDDECGICQACDGQGNCGNVNQGYDPLEDCGQESAESCGQTGLCDGQGACALWGEETVCSVGGCAGESYVPDGLCDGAGNCMDSSPVDCRPFGCGATGCNLACEGDGECAVGAACDTEMAICYPSCEAYCDGPNPLGCFCDSNCAANGDCCNDVCSWCEHFWCGGSLCGGSCEGKECGDDGCGMSCGTCANGMACDNYTCAATTPGFVPLYEGDFWMGSPSGCPGPTGYNGDCTVEAGRGMDETLHYVSLTRPLEIMSHEVTQGDWSQRFRSQWNPSGAGTCTDCPVDSVSWYDALIYANLVSEQYYKSRCYYFSDVVCNDGTPVGEEWRWCMNDVHGGIASASVSNGQFQSIYDCPGYRLPTEAEWEYATRAGTVAAYHDGLVSDGANLNCETPFHLTAYEWTCANSGGASHTVETRSPNPWGLYDMAGNLSEWVGDGGQAYEPGTLLEPLVNPEGVGADKVYRGGAWDGGFALARSAKRFVAAPDALAVSRGFRLVRTIQCVPEPEVCGDDIDNDCDGQIDEEGATGCTLFYPDLDADNHGDLEDPGACLCAASDSYPVAVQDDCDDLDPTIYAGHAEICDGKDNNCNSYLDDGFTFPSYENYPTCYNAYHVGTIVAGSGKRSILSYVYPSGDTDAYKIFAEEEGDLLCIPLTTQDYYIDFSLTYAYAHKCVNYKMMVYDEACVLIGSGTVNSCTSDHVQLYYTGKCTIDDNKYWTVVVQGETAGDWDCLPYTLEIDFYEQ